MLPMVSSARQSIHRLVGTGLNIVPSHLKLKVTNGPPTCDPALEQDQLVPPHIITPYLKPSILE